ncbi:hypothetical protein FB451DRAFT_1391618 [Mycena latifolia]|nr:hypothetical protein FB451DRAFT_1391618 [Mycena latifolia]
MLKSLTLTFPSIDLIPRTVPGFANITSASWIWGATSGPSIAFRRVYTSPAGKSAVLANCQADSANLKRFYLNGMGGFIQFAILNLALNPFSNLFAVSVTGQNTAGFIAACQIVFSDGTIDTLVTDASWQTAPISGNDLNTFMQPVYYETSSWGAATVIPSMPIAPVQPMPPAVGFASSFWIWTNEGTSPPGEARAFRYTFTPPEAQLPLFATVVVTCDNSYTFWLNGGLVAVSPTATDWTTAQRYVLALQPDTNVFAFAGFNADVGPSPAGLLVSVQVQLAAGGLVNFATNSSWLTLNGQAPPFNFQLPTFNDSAWNNATVYALYGGGPWGNQVTIPSLLP